MESPDTTMTRSDFMKKVGAGLGAAGFMALSSANAQTENERAGAMVVISHGGGTPHKAMLGLICALKLIEGNNGKVHIWMVVEGAELANKSKSQCIESSIFKKFGTAADVMQKLQNKGATFSVCPLCAEYMGATKENKYDFIELHGADWFVINQGNAHVIYM